MLARAENELLTRVGPGTPMGNLVGRFWQPFGLAAELAGADCDPIRVRVLGEDLVALRDSHGSIGLLAANCPHRGASLFFGRNEEAGMRCVYHGWKFAVDGTCVDMPNPRSAALHGASEPAESDFRTRVKAVAYPCQERGGIVWAYMGTRADPPPLTDLEPKMLPDGAWALSICQRDCNWQ